MYDEGKNRFPHPSIADFGFGRRQKIAFEYVRADFGKFQAEEEATIKPMVTDEDIEKHYEENKERYKEIDLPGQAEPSAGTEETDKNPEQPIEGEETKDGASDPAPKPEGSDEAANKPDEGSDEKSDPALQPADPASEGKPAEAKIQEKATGSADDAEAKAGQGGCLGQQAAAASDPAASDSAAEPEPPVEETSTEEPAEEVDKPAKASQPAKPAADDDPTAAEEKPVDSPTKTEEPVADSVEEKPDESATVGEEDTETEPEEEETRYKPLDDKLREEIRGEIAKERARKPAQDRLDTAMNAIQAEIDKYGREFRRLLSRKFRCDKSDLNISNEEGEVRVSVVTVDYEQKMAEVRMMDTVRTAQVNTAKVNRYKVSWGDLDP